MKEHPEVVLDFGKGGIKKAGELGKLRFGYDHWAVRTKLIGDLEDGTVLMVPIDVVMLEMNLKISLGPAQP